jgi:hypothetical protein
MVQPSTPNASRYLPWLIRREGRVVATVVAIAVTIC